MTDLTPIVHRDRRLLAAIATEEQARLVDWLHARAQAERDHVKRHTLIGQRDDANLAWGEIIWWLTDQVVPEGLTAALHVAERAATKAKQRWDREDGGSAANPRAAHFLGLIVIDRMLHETFAPRTFAQEQAA